MTTFVHVISLTATLYPVLTQSEDILGDGEMTRDELEAMLPEGERLSEGHYEISDDGVARWVGFDLPPPADEADEAF